MDRIVIERLLKESKKRKFTQTVELIINLKKTYDLKKNENKFLEYIELPKGRGKKNTIAAIVGPELEKLARDVFDYVITKDELKDIGQNKRKAKEIAKKYYIFVAQASTMIDLGKYMGKYLSTRGKMPNPKYGMVFPDNFTKDQLKSLYDKLQKYVRVEVKKHITFGIPIGTEKMKVEDLLENANYALNYIINRLPDGKNAIRSVYIKLTMSQAYRIL